MRDAPDPVLMRDVIADLDAVVDLLVHRAPYAPLGGWYNPDADPHARTRPMWFRDDWAHADVVVPGAEIFLCHEGYLAAAKDVFGAEVVEPTSVYVNLMTGIAEGGPAHTDNPRFHGRDRTNTPMWLLRQMLWSGLFDRYEIAQATAIWWLDDVEGGALRYWADGPGLPPREHAAAMANSALFGDNHGMFHQVGPVGPFEHGTRLVTPLAELAPADDRSGEWVVTDHGEQIHRAPLSTIRVSVLWKADVYPSESERARRMSDSLSLEDVAAIFDLDLAERGVDLRLDPARFDDAGVRAALAAIYPEDLPVDALASVFDVYA
jgi:hypothetical protein